MLEKHYISEGFFTDEEIKEFKEKFGYDIRSIYYASKYEIDFSNSNEKEYLLKQGHPRILARFFN